MELTPKINIMEDGILTACIKQIQDDDTVFNFNISTIDVIFTATRKNKTGEFKLKTEQFFELLNSNLDTQFLFASWFGNAYNELLEKEGSKTKLMV